MNRMIASLVLVALTLTIPGCAADANSTDATSDDFQSGRFTIGKIANGTADANDASGVLSGFWAGLNTEGRNVEFSKSRGNTVAFAWDVYVPNIVDLEATYGVRVVQTMYTPTFIAAMRALSVAQVERLGGSLSPSGGYALRVKGTASLVGEAQDYKISLAPQADVPEAFRLALSDTALTFSTKLMRDHTERVCLRSRTTSAGTVCEFERDQFVPGNGCVDLMITFKGDKPAGVEGEVLSFRRRIL
jgi:hypothetical protein